MRPLALLSTLLGTLMLTACTQEIAVANHDSSMLIAAIRIANATPGAERITLAHRGLYVINDPAEPGLLLPALTGKLTIDGNGAEIRSYAEGPVALLEVTPGSDVTLRGLSLAEGSDGAVRNFGKLRLQSSRIVDSTGSLASAIVLNRGQLEVDNSEVAYNSLQGGRADTGTILNYGSLRLDRPRIHDNVAGPLSFAGIVNLGSGRVEGSSAAGLIRDGGNRGASAGL